MKVIFFAGVDVPTEGGGDDTGAIVDKIAKMFREYKEDSLYRESFLYASLSVVVKNHKIKKY